ncbi:hypothetical protein ACJJTC_018444 [Scirpophaga incertulas]
MDQYTSDLLCKWGLIEYVNIFADAKIDITTLQLIGDTEITALISTIGDRLRLKSNLEIWKKELGTSASSELPLSPTKYQAKRNASGILFNAYTTRRKHLRNLGILPQPARSRSHSRASTISSTDTTELTVPGSGIQISELQRDDPSVSEENLTILESPDPGPWQQVEKYWSSTVCARLRYLYYEKGMLTDYLNRFPILKSSSGFTLLLQDYENLYPKNTAGMTNLIYV